MNNTFLAVVILTAPELGVAVVVPNAGCLLARCPKIGLLPYSDTSHGVGIYKPVQAGSTVLCSALYGENNPIVSIVAPLGVDMDLLNDSFLHRKLTGESIQTQSGPGMLANISALEKLLPNRLSSFVRNHANGADGDILPGDLDLIDKQTQVGVHIGRNIVSLKGSALASVDVLSAGDAVRLVGDTVSIHTLGHESESSVDGYIRNTAISTAEAFGLKTGPAARVNGEALVPANDQALPFYRIQHVEGAAVDGTEDNVLDFPHKADTHDSNSEPSVLSSRRQSLSGQITDSSSGGISFVKTPYLSASLQTGYGEKPTRAATIPKGGSFGLAETFDDLREPYEPKQKATDEQTTEAIDEDRKTIDAALNKLITGLLEGEHQKALLDVMARHGFSRSSVDGTVGSRIQGETKEPGGATTAQFYPLPPYTVVTDPITGKPTKHYQSLSFLSQEPDGSICISDGYGSEIRMCRGNIYIAPALDLVFRPGRHMYGMVPGYMALNARDRCDIASGHDTVSIKAAKDIKIAAGANDGAANRGDVTIESLSNSGGDILLKTAGSLSALASTSVVVGHQPGDRGACPVHVDAGEQGSVYIKGVQTTLDAHETVICGASQGGDTPKGSAVVVNEYAISLLTPAITAPAEIHTERVEKTPGVVLVRNNKKAKANIRTASAGGSVRIGGSLLVDEQLSVNGGAQIYNVVTTATAEIRQKDYAKHKTPSNKAVSSDAGVAAADTSVSLADNIYNNKYIDSLTFKYPDSYGVDMSVIPGMRWQDLSRLSGSAGSIWNEPRVNDTQCFPGKSVWSSANLSSRGYNKNLTLADGYVTNN